MQALSYIPHIVADIFAFYTLSQKRFHTILRIYFGGVKGNDQLNDYLFQAARLWASYVRDRRIAVEFDPLEPDDVKVVKCLDPTERIRISDDGGREFDAIISPMRFPSHDTLIVGILYGDNLRHSPNIKSLIARRGQQARVPLGLKHLIYYVHSVDPINNKDISDEIISTLETLGLSYMDLFSWWPGVTKVGRKFSYGPAPKLVKDIINMERKEIYMFFVSNPAYQNDLVDFRCSIGGSQFRIKRVKGGAPIMPRIDEDNSIIDFSHIEGIVKLESYCFSRVIAPLDTSILKSVGIDGADFIEAAGPFLAVRSVFAEYPHSWNLLEPLTINVERFKTLSRVDVVDLKGKFITHVDAVRCENVILGCPRLEVLEAWDVQLPMRRINNYKYVRATPFKIELPYRTRHLHCATIYHKYVKEYRVDSELYDKLHAKFLACDAITVHLDEGGYPPVVDTGFESQFYSESDSDSNSYSDADLESVPEY